MENILHENREIKSDVDKSSLDLNAANSLLGFEENPSANLLEAIDKHKITEDSVAASGRSLGEVNNRLALQIDSLADIRGELVDAKFQLDEARMDLIDSRNQTDEARRQIALEDPLTGLPNRSAFEQRLELSLSQARRHGWELAVFSIDVDEFKNINDSLGHDVGDEVLQMVATRLALLVREDDMVSRWGGDEFVCLLLEVGSPSSLTRLANKMVARIAEPYVLHQKVLRVQVSLGIAIFPAHGSSAEILLRHADLAMYLAKGEKDHVVLFEYHEPA